MEKEVSNGAMLGIVLIALAAIIGLGFGIFGIAKGTANEGVTAVQENLGAISNSVFNDFDQKVVTGTQIVSCMQDFSGKTYSILIATSSVKNNTASTGNILTSSAGFDKYGTSLKPPTASAYTNESMTVTHKVAKSTDLYEATSCQLTFVQYNALLANEPSYGIAQIGFDQNCWRALKGYKNTDSKVDVNGITANISKSGMVEYVPASARFQAYLIKDLSGTIMGIAFEQIDNN